MSDRGDLLKALARAGYKLDSNGRSRHLMYTNGVQWLAVPKGGKMSPALVRGILSKIRKGTNARHQHELNGRKHDQVATQDEC